MYVYFYPAFLKNRLLFPVHKEKLLFTEANKSKE